MKITRPSFPAPPTKPNDVFELFASEDSIVGVHIEDTWLTSDELGKKSIAESLMTKAVFSELNVTRFDIHDCEFKGCTFTAAKFPESTWNRISISGTRCSGLQITNGIIKNVEFKNSKLEIVNFRFSQLENVYFEGCALDDVDFYEARLKNVEFVNCTINKVTFAKAKMVNVDISQSAVEGINGINSLRGVTMSHDQLLQLAPEFAAEAGIKIK
jgi:uncharacterized protein YjbI with pentapeptide repeats